MEAFKFTIRILKKRPFRSLLTVLQMGLGVWIVAIILSLNLQASGNLSAINRNMGDSVAKISVSKRQEFADGSIAIGSTSNLQVGDLVRLQESDHIESAFIFQSQWGTKVMAADTAYSVSIVAEATAEYAEALNFEFVEGHSFTAGDQVQKNRVVLISEIAAEQFFPEQSALGESIYLGNYGESLIAYEIIGVYKPQSPLLEYFISPAHLVFPLGVNQPMWMEEEDRVYHEIFIKAKPDQVYEAVADARVLLADRSLDDFEVHGEYFKDSNRFFEEQIRTITLFLGAFAFISILISAIGILSIMLVSVVERTKEIGLRKALGASKWLIIREILTESFVFSLLGAVVGLIIAYFTADSLLGMLVQEVVYPRLTSLGGLHPLAALIAVCIAVLLGQIFGFYPALQGAKMSPVDALRDS